VCTQVEEYRLNLTKGAKIKTPDEVFDILQLDELELRKNQMIAIEQKKKVE